MKTIDFSKREVIYTNSDGQEQKWVKRSRDGHSTWCHSCGEQVFLDPPIGNGICPECGCNTISNENCACKSSKFKVDGHEYNRVLYQEDLDSDQVLCKMNDLHKARFNELVSYERHMDIYRETLFFIMSGNDELYKIIKGDIDKYKKTYGKVHIAEGASDIYDFHYRDIFPFTIYCLEGSSKALMELALQLYTDVYPEKNQYQIFRQLNKNDLKVAWMAIAIRYDIDIE